MIDPDGRTGPSRDDDGLDGLPLQPAAAYAGSDGARARGRASALILAFCAGFAILAVRAAQIGLFRDVDEAGRAARAETLSPSARADIVDRNGQLLATSLATQSLYADPKRIWDPLETARALRTVFPDMDEAQLVRRLSGDSRFVWIRRRLTPHERHAVWALAQPGLEFAEDSDRIYPMGRLAGHVLGSINAEGQPINGMERAMDGRLSAKAGNGTRPAPLRLSIDARVQHVVEAELEAAALDQGAIGGAAVIMDVATGEVVASASWPFLDPNTPERATPDQQNNRVTNSRFEMGSTFKVFTVAIGLEDGVIDPDSTFDASQPIRIDGQTIHDFHGQNRIMSVTEILAHSSNIGTVRIAAAVGAPRVREFFRRLGLMEAAGGELLENARPLLPRDWSEISAATASFGHGIAVSPMAVVGAFGALGNEGRYVEPTFLARAPAHPAAWRPVVSPGTSREIISLMRDVVTSGTGRKADTLGWPMAGKTGTAEKSGPGGYDSNRRVSSFAGMFPADRPRYAILFLLDEPKGSAETGGGATAGLTAAPAVSRIVARAAPMLGLPPRPAALTAANADPRARTP